MSHALPSMLPRRARPLLALGLVVCTGLACAGPRVEVRGPQGEPIAAAAEPEAVPGPGEQAWVPVVLPPGDCPTGRLELQVFDHERDAWVPHPTHRYAPAGACLRERADRLLTDLRVRCVDPEGRRAPSPWIAGVQLDDPAEADACPELLGE